MLVASNDVGQQAEFSPQAPCALTDSVGACRDNGAPPGAVTDKRILSRLTLDDIPIPRDVRVHDDWPPLLSEMADHIGAYDTLMICDHFAGRDVYIPTSPELSPFRGIVSDENVKVMAHVYGRERLPIPTGRNTILHAKRQGIIAAVRAGRLNVGQGARIIRMARRHLSRLVNQTDEGVGYAPIELPEPRLLIALREAAQIAAEQLRTAAKPFDAVEATTAKILDIFFKPTTTSKGTQP